MADACTASPNAYTNCLRINRMRLGVSLGCEKEERANPQAVDIDITFFFPALTEASFSDSGDFICYGKLSYRLKELCEGREFKLIEYLGLEIYNEARSIAPTEVKITVQVTKCNIPVSFVLGGASFMYTDLPAHAWTPPV